MFKRSERVGELIKKELGKIILKEIELPAGLLVTLTRVEVSKNFDHCRVFVSCFPEEKRKEVLEILKKNIFFIQKILDKKLVMKKVPKIVFLEEKKVVEAGKIEKVLADLKKEKN